MFLIMDSCGRIIGEAVPLLSLRGILEFWNEIINKQTPHIMLTLRYRFKGETWDRWHLVIIADHTQ